ncbi:MAG: glycosyltransferase family 2 protein [Xanthomonadales bacterium]|nr:glycosyltransferase family 2 protein [Xanthomonadales bacterium]
MPNDAVRCCLVIPHYDHVEQLRLALPGFVRTGLKLIVVDDASPAIETEKLQAMLREQAPNAMLVLHERNQGKGGAVMSGLRTAHDVGFTHALQVDADGQHDVQSLPRLLQAVKERPDELICGLPSFGPDISRLRYYARYITLYLCWLETLSREIKDALCGFRAYPLQPILAIIDSSQPGRRMAFDPEILVRACWDGIGLRYIPVKVNYPQGGRSHFHYVRDNLEIGWMHVRLICGMLVRLPQLLARKFK